MSAGDLNVLINAANLVARAAHGTSQAYDDQQTLILRGQHFSDLWSQLDRCRGALQARPDLLPGTSSAPHILTQNIDACLHSCSILLPDFRSRLESSSGIVKAVRHAFLGSAFERKLQAATLGAQRLLESLQREALVTAGARSLVQVHQSATFKGSGPDYVPPVKVFEVVLQKSQAMLRQPDSARAICICGPWKLGKTSLAQAVAKELSAQDCLNFTCFSMDCSEHDTPEKTLRALLGHVVVTSAPEDDLGALRRKLTAHLPPACFLLLDDIKCQMTLPILAQIDGLKMLATSTLDRHGTDEDGVLQINLTASDNQECARAVFRNIVGSKVPQESALLAECRGCMTFVKLAAGALKSPRNETLKIRGKKMMAILSRTAPPEGPHGEFRSQKAVLEVGDERIKRLLEQQKLLSSPIARILSALRYMPPNRSIPLWFAELATNALSPAPLQTDFGEIVKILEGAFIVELADREPSLTVSTIVSLVLNNPEGRTLEPVSAICKPEQDQLQHVKKCLRKDDAPNTQNVFTSSAAKLLRVVQLNSHRSEPSKVSQVKQLIRIPDCEAALLLLEGALDTNDAALVRRVWSLLPELKRLKAAADAALQLMAVSHSSKPFPYPGSSFGLVYAIVMTHSCDIAEQTARSIAALCRGQFSTLADIGDPISASDLQKQLGIIVKNALQSDPEPARQADMVKTQLASEHCSPLLEGLALHAPVSAAFQEASMLRELLRAWAAAHCLDTWHSRILVLALTHPENRSQLQTAIYTAAAQLAGQAATADAAKQRAGAEWLWQTGSGAGSQLSYLLWELLVAEAKSASSSMLATLAPFRAVGPTFAPLTDQLVQDSLHQDSRKVEELWTFLKAHVKCVRIDHLRLGGAWDTPLCPSPTQQPSFTRTISMCWQWAVHPTSSTGHAHDLVASHCLHRLPSRASVEASAFARQQISIFHSASQESTSIFQHGSSQACQLGQTTGGTRVHMTFRWLVMIPAILAVGLVTLLMLWPGFLASAPDVLSPVKKGMVQPAANGSGLKVCSSVSWHRPGPAPSLQ